MLRNARIVDQDEKDVRFVSVGSTVLLKDLETDQNYTYTIVGTAEADPGANKISNESPVGRALLGLSVGEVVEVNVPAGLLRFKILEIS